jgi:hypothetical protein
MFNKFGSVLEWEELRMKYVVTRISTCWTNGFHLCSNHYQARFIRMLWCSEKAKELMTDLWLDAVGQIDGSSGTEKETTGISPTVAGREVGEGLYLVNFVCVRSNRQAHAADIEV